MGILDALRVGADTITSRFVRRPAPLTAASFRGIAPTPRTMSDAERRRTAGPYARKRRRHEVDAEWLEQVNKSDILRVPLMHTARTGAAVPWRLWRLGKPGPDGEPERIEVRHHRLKSLWARPNPHMTGTQFREIFIVYKKAVGCVPIRVFYGDDGLPESLWPIPKNAVKEMPRISNPPRAGDRNYWLIHWFGEDVKIPVECLIWITQVDPADPYGRGIGDAQCLAKTVQLVHMMDDWSLYGFRNGSHIGKLIGVPLSGNESIADFEEDIEANHGGVESTGRNLYVKLINNEPAVQVHDLGATHKDLDWVEGRKQASKRSRQVFGKPPELVGDVDDSNRATAQEADFIDSKNNIKPELVFMAEQMAAWLTPLFGEPDLLLEPDECVKETADHRHKVLTDGWVRSTITRDQWLIGHGMEPIGGELGRQYFFQLNSGFIDSLTGEFIVPPGAKAGDAAGGPSGDDHTEGTGDSVALAGEPGKPKANSLAAELAVLRAEMDLLLVAGPHYVNGAKALNGTAHGGSG